MTAAGQVMKHVAGLKTSMKAAAEAPKAALTAQHIAAALAVLHV